MRMTPLDKWLLLLSAILAVVLLGILPALESPAAIDSGQQVTIAWAEHLKLLGCILLVVWGLRIVLAVFFIMAVMYLNIF